MFFTNCLTGLALAAVLPLCAQPIHTFIANPGVIDTPGAYILRSHIEYNASQGRGILITASGVTLDLNGFQIKGPGGKQGMGIVVNGARGVAIRNGAVADSAFGVAVMNSSNVTLTGLLIRGQALPVVAPPPETGVMIVNSRNVVVRNNAIHDVGLGIFVRGGMSAGNRISDNTVSTSANGVFGICYNPADTGTAGPRGDLVQNNLISGFGVSISVSAGSASNVFKDNTLAYITGAFESGNPSNMDMNNTKIQLP